MEDDASVEQGKKRARWQQGRLHQRSEEEVWWDETFRK